MTPPNYRSIFERRCDTCENHDRDGNTDRIICWLHEREVKDYYVCDDWR